jgi:hypothetical protein
MVTVAELPGFFVTSLPDWQNRFAIWALVLGAFLVLGGSGLLSRRPARPQTRTDMLRAHRTRQHNQSLRAPRTGCLLCVIGVAMAAFPFVNVNWLTAA